MSPSRSGRLNRGRAPAENGNRAESMLPTLGYRMHDANAVYLPHWSQVWIDAEGVRGDRHQVLTHELYHFFASSDQPAMLVPLQSFMTGRLDQNTFMRFEDIVEPLAAIMVGVLDGQKLDAARIRTSTKEHASLVRQIYQIAMTLSGSSQSALPARVNEAVRAVAFLLMHIFSYRPGNAEYVLQVLRRSRRWNQWSDRWDLFPQLYEVIHRNHQSSLRTQTRYHLAPPVDVHRSVGEQLVFMSGAMRIAEQQRERCVAAMPALLSVVSLGSFVILPIVTIDGTVRNRMRARINVVHSTRRGERRIREILELQTALRASAVGRDSSCLATQYSVDVLEMFRPHRISNSVTRLGSAIAHALEQLPARVATLARAVGTCPGCRALLGDPAVGAACHHVSLMPRSQRRGLIDAATGYETWLRNKCLQESISAGSGVRIQTVKQYRYL
jgi:hypothetical protein